MSEPAAKTATTGIYCKKCGYDLRASGEAGRCPECGRAFSPDDPKTFRPRPFAAPWQRAVGRWAKRAAILLLVLAVLLAGVWSWLYWGWHEELAVLEGPGSQYRWLRTSVGGAPGRWLWEHHVPGSFVLARVKSVELPETSTDADLLPLRKLRELEVLQAFGPITDAGLASLGQCPRLRELWLLRPRVSAAGLATLRDLPRLKLLALNQDAVTDAGLAGLETLPQLQYLFLDGTPVTDAGLIHLEKLRTLEGLSLRGTQVTDAGVARLQAALPGCRIIGP